VPHLLTSDDHLEEAARLAHHATHDADLDTAMRHAYALVAGVHIQIAQMLAAGNRRAGTGPDGGTPAGHEGVNEEAANAPATLEGVVQKETTPRIPLGLPFEGDDRGPASAPRTVGR
jgi:hypothetical protein